MPREGHDAIFLNHAYLPRYFNPRAPRGARLAEANGFTTDPVISIHVPREGHDVGLWRLHRDEVLISIHVPREGHD